MILMGSPGSGKTTVGRLVSPRLGMPQLDIDNDFLEIHWNTTVADKVCFPCPYTDLPHPEA